MNRKRKKKEIQGLADGKQKEKGKEKGKAD